MQSFDLKLNLTDFAAVPWETVLKGIPERECSAYCALFKGEAEKCKTAKDERGEKVFTLLHAVVSLFPNFSSNQTPFRAAILFPTFRSAALDDFAASDVAVLSELAPTIKDAELRARVAD